MFHNSTPPLFSRLIRRTSVAFLITAAVALPAGVGTAMALADSGDTSAVAINTKDGSSVFRVTFAIRQLNGSVVDPQNAAVAYSSCTDCQTVAISIEVVLVSGDPTTFTPVNEALAINVSCSSCDSLAAAYQFVDAIGAQLKLTADGRQEIAYIRQQLEQLRNSGLTIDAIAERVKALMGQLGDVLNTQLIGVSAPAAGPGTGGTTTAPSSSSPTSSTPTDTTTTPSSTPTDTTTTPTSAPSDTTTTPTSTPTDTTSTPTDTTTSATGTSSGTPTSSSTTATPTTTTTTTSSPTTTAPTTTTTSGGG